MTRLPIIVAIVALGATLLAQPSPPRLFEDVAGQLEAEQMLGAVRSRTIGININLIGGADGRLAPVPKLRLNLFPGVELTATLDHFEGLGQMPGVSWSGTIDGTSFGSVTLANVNGFVSGRVSAAGKTYAVRGQGAAATVSEIDESLLPEHENDTLPAPPSADDVGAFNPSADDGSVIDIGVFFSDASERAAGGQNAILADIRTAVAIANVAFSWSDVRTRLNWRIWGRYTGGDRGDMADDLVNATFYSRGFHRVRDDTKLDLVALVTTNDDRYCGIAWVNKLDAQGTLAYSVTHQDCLVGLTFAHEIGHNLGAKHDWYVDHDAGAYDFSHGHVDRQLGYRTIMSYRNVCQATGIECPRIQWFSNPTINVMPTSRFIGVRVGTDRSCREGNASRHQCDADSARTFDHMRKVIARFR